ncbi:hypothetical protein BO99DRAFT_173885 [Aspergillus violaceofuscus CBS 115571]|uniref:Uncharacterized protein n=1 Tax=Aspergillus violaceofuscus (strain CBS 115571) TaxID=1450538 RepID=A0A2V5HP85_ASPV1|nr:hypothetical protein BO99DRAFT_173885 [Aspergillus violaceofuscus CBS 115571]
MQRDHLWSRDHHLLLSQHCWLCNITCQIEYIWEPSIRLRSCHMINDSLDVYAITTVTGCRTSAIQSSKVQPWLPVWLCLRV